MGREIDDEDVSRVVRGAHQLPADEEVLHTVRQHFRVDGQDDAQQPVAAWLQAGGGCPCGLRPTHPHSKPGARGKRIGSDVEDVTQHPRAPYLSSLRNWANKGTDDRLGRGYGGVFGLFG